MRKRTGNCTRRCGQERKQPMIETERTRRERGQQIIEQAARAGKPPAPAKAQGGPFQQRAEAAKAARKAAGKARRAAAKLAAKARRKSAAAGRRKRGRRQ